MNHKYTFDFLRIIQIDGSDIFYHIHIKKPLNIENHKDEFNPYFKELLSPNLDLIYLNLIEKLTVKKLNNEQFSFDIINVSFDYQMKIDKNGELIKKKLNNKVAFVKSTKDIRNYLYTYGFKLNGKEYVRYKRTSSAARNGTCLFIKKDLFKEMEKWSNAGLDPNKYVKDIVSFEAYKALTLSSLIGTIKLKPKNILLVKDHVAIIKNEPVARVYVENKKLKVSNENCDIKNNIWDGEGLLDASVFARTKTITNGIEKSLRYKGMMLLRNRFFKSCVFNTNLQKWFKENQITDVSQLNGITFAENVEDIKMVITESSLKYIKMVGGDLKEAFNKWCNNISDKEGFSLFGIVKTDKPQRFFYGDMVTTSYQLLNTLHLKHTDTLKLLNLNFNYLEKIRNISETPQYLRLYLKGEIDPYKDFLNRISDLIDDTEADSEEYIEDIKNISVYNYKKFVCDILLDINRDVLKTSAFRYFVYDETINMFAMKFYDGKILVNGTYATLFGNPYELLLNVINKFDGKSKFLHKGEVCTSFFDEGAEITGARNPHVTMGNLLLAKNKKDEEVLKWFNLTREIIIVDAIENNIQHRLNGADYDSDTMLITDNNVIVNATKEQYDNFLVPYSDLETKENEINLKTSRTSLLFAMDFKIANNLVGQISNYSQLLNSYYWDCFNRRDVSKLDEIYLTICKAAVLSGAEIDSAKRNFSFKTTNELNDIKEHLKEFNLIPNGKKLIRQPLFFLKINDKDCKIGKIDSYVGNNYTKNFQTAMDYIWKNIYGADLEGKRFRNPTNFSELTKGNIPQNKAGGTQYRNADKAIKILEDIYEKILVVKNESKNDRNNDKKYFELGKKEFKEIIDKNISRLQNHLIEIDKVRLIIRKLEAKKGETGKNANIFFLLFYLIIKSLNHNKKEIYSFLKELFVSNSPVPSLKRVFDTASPEFELFDKKYCYKENRDTADILIDTLFS